MDWLLFFMEEHEANRLARKDCAWCGGTGWDMMWAEKQVPCSCVYDRFDYVEYFTRPPVELVPGGPPF